MYVSICVYVCIFVCVCVCVCVYVSTRVERTAVVTEFTRIFAGVPW